MSRVSRSEMQDLTLRVHAITRMLSQYVLITHVVCTHYACCQTHVVTVVLMYYITLSFPFLSASHSPLLLAIAWQVDWHHMLKATATKSVVQNS